MHFSNLIILAHLITRDTFCAAVILFVRKWYRKYHFCVLRTITAGDRMKAGQVTHLFGAGCFRLEPGAPRTHLSKYIKLGYYAVSVIYN
jgi:hypothetical protein